jgi:putative Mn2+ efflux pump MntP
LEVNTGSIAIGLSCRTDALAVGAAFSVWANVSTSSAMRVGCFCIDAVVFARYLADWASAFLTGSFEANETLCAICVFCASAAIIDQAVAIVVFAVADLGCW